MSLGFESSNAYGFLVFRLLPDPASEPGRLAVKVMQLALGYWYEATDPDKAALAMESGIWKTYTDRNGYSRTQTLDRYLKEETLPRQPRRKWVNQTAVYVLSACNALCFA